jgi:membrane-associated phospholipid phosphatase
LATAAATQNRFFTEVSMRLLFLSLLIIGSGRATLTAQAPTKSGDDVSVTVRWNRLVPKLVAENAAARRAARKAAAGDSAALHRLAMAQPPILFKVYSLLSVAQYGAVNGAGDGHSISPEAAIASASAAVLNQLYADSTVRSSIARELANDLERAGTGQRTAAGKILGEGVAQRVIAWAPSADFMAPWNGTIPKGPGFWHSAPGTPPIGIALVNARTWILDSTSQFRPAPPPAFGSSAWLSAIDEVRRISRTRTAQQTRIAQKWDSGDPWGVWNEVAASIVTRHHLSDRDAAKVLAVLNVAALDAITACFEAKYHYWTIRPSQADTTIALADSVGLPNFPSFPSGHACSAGAFDGTLSTYFPQDRAEFKRIAEEQAMSRLLGGIHYRFDNDGGLALGRVVARYAVEQEKRGRLNAWRDTPVARKP